MRRRLHPGGRRLPAVLAAALVVVLGQGLAARADGERLQVDDPGGSGISLTVDPGELAVKQGDVVRLHFAGLEAGEYVYSLGTCPADLPVAEMGTQRFVGQLACSARLPTGLSGDIDPSSINTPGLSTSTFLGFPSADGTVDVDYFVGSGVSVGTLGYQVVLANGDRESHESLTCDTDDACTIGFVVQRKDGVSTWTDLTTLRFNPAPADGAAVGGCQGLDAARTVDATGPERLQTPVSELNRAYCAASASPIPVSYVPGGAGEDDPAGVPAVGSTSDLAFVGSPELARHPISPDQIAVPIALNSVAVAQIGGLTSPSLTTGQLAYNGVDPGPLALKASDVARILLHDFPTRIPAELPTTPAAARAYNPLAADILSRPGNAAALGGLDVSMIGLPFVVAPTVTYSVGADSTAIGLSAYLTDRAATAWTYPENAVNDDLERSGDAVERIPSFDPLVDRSKVATGSILTSQTSSVGGLYSAKASKDITIGAFANTCPYFVGSSSLPAYQRALTKGCFRFAVMDTATASSVATTAARIENGADFVAPTTASMQAAAATELGADGVFTADASAAYPLTFVEYAIVPKGPLLDDTCTARAQQATLTRFLSYAVGDGQDALSGGLAPLTPTLAGRARAAIAQLGQAVPTGACAPAPAPAATPTPTPTPSASFPGSTGSGTTGSGVGGTGTTGGFPSGGTGSDVVDTAVPVAAGGPDTPDALADAEPVANAEAAPFQGAAGTSSSSVLIGLLLLGLLMAAAGLGAGSGGPVSRVSRLIGRSPR